MSQPLASLVLVCLAVSPAFGASIASNFSSFSTNCGRSLTQDLSWRIVGGTRALKGEFPWQIQMIATLTDQFGRQGYEMCGGSIINEQWVLTAGHCVGQSSDPRVYTIKLGLTDLRTPEGYQSGVSKVIHHENFVMDDRSGLVRNDIALLKLDGTIDFDKYTDLEPVCLATASTQITGTCIASGFGLLNFNQNTQNGAQASQLMKVAEPIVDNSRCTRIFPYFSAQQNVCAGGSARGGTGTCKGDSGGPLQCKGSDGKYYQVGVVSYGMPCAMANYADVFTKVSAFVDWIETTIARN